MTRLIDNRLHRRRAVAILVAMLGIVAVSQVVAAMRPPAPASKTGVDPLAPTIADLDGAPAANDGADSDVASSVGRDVSRIKANISFWSERVERQPDDFVSTNRLGVSEIDLARATGDLTAYLRAGAAFDLTLRRDPRNAAAIGYKGSVLVSLHRFDEARNVASQVLQDRPHDPVALATLGDASLELGDVEGAAAAYDHADRIAHGSATLTRLAHLAFIRGETTIALQRAAAAVEAGKTEGVDGERAAFLDYQLAELRASAGDLDGARAAYAAALRADPGSFLARSGLARIAASEGHLDDAIARLSEAIAIVPQPEFLARRGDLYAVRGGKGDAGRAADDYATVESIAKLAGEAAGVYDRTLAYYLANHGLDPERAVRLAAAELEVRKDAHGFDAYAWALLAAGRTEEAHTAMSSALAFGTRDAEFLYHAGMIAKARADRASAVENIAAALALDPSFDPLQVVRARGALTALR